jgi:hypothetical protein
MAMDERARAKLSVVVAGAAVVFMVVGNLAFATGATATNTFRDDDGNVHEGMIEAIHQAGITGGCSATDPGLYCPASSVTRAQMASFLARAFALPAATQDYFTDDNGSVHEDNINRVAQAGITGGTTPGHYSPSGAVTRAQMGSFLARALHLDPSVVNHFLDVSGVHTGNINAIFEQGITTGCDAAGTMYCPGNPVRRDQMASFLGRALGLSPAATTTSTSSSSSSTSSTSSTSSSSTSSSTTVTVPISTTTTVTIPVTTTTITLPISTTTTITLPPVTLPPLLP